MICNGAPTFRKLGHMMSFSAGVMIFISFMDLLPESVESIGFINANLYVIDHHILFQLLYF